jgi:CRISPR-associated endonuclease Cas1
MVSTYAATQALSVRTIKPIVPREGVVTLFGYGISARVERGHLILEDGVGCNRRATRLPRVGHGLRRLVVIGSDGSVSLAALRWLADQDAAFVMLERDGSVLATTGPVRPSDSRLRRAQSLANSSHVGTEIARELIGRKLVGQERVIREKLGRTDVAESIAEYRTSLMYARTTAEVRHLESVAAQAYWLAWRFLPIKFPESDIDRVPLHWRTFGTRKSPITDSQRLAVNPLNAMLNYSYAVLESESRLALAALGLDPGIGVIHVDVPSRDSFACDLMEAVRPQVDSYVFDWISREPLRRSWFFEESDGNCRLMGSFAERLSETSATWGRAVAPVAEWLSRKLWSTLRKPVQQTVPATRLTQSRRRQVKGSSTETGSAKGPKVPRICCGCGSDLKRGRTLCAECSKVVSRENLLVAANLGRIATHGPEAEKRRAETQNRQREAIRSWNPADKPDWLSEKYYRETVVKRLKSIPVPAIAATLRVSEPYATEIRNGRLPHPRHWFALLRLVTTPPRTSAAL